jgi:hypothetical protein
VAAVGAALHGGRTATLVAQSARDQLFAGIEAFENAEDERALRLLSVGLDPGGGPLDSTWVAGLYRLIRVLATQGQDTAAAAWLRWAHRVKPVIEVDEAYLLPAEIAAIAAARDHVADNPPTAAGAWAEVSYRWRPGAPLRRGVLHIPRGPVPLSGRIERGEFFAAGDSVALAPGSYRVQLSAPGGGFFSAFLNVEVLPGVATIARVELVPTDAGFLHVASRPWGRVILGERAIGYTPLARYRVAPGTHRLRIERSGYPAFDTTITVLPSDTTRVGNVRLEGAAEEAAGDLAPALAALDSAHVERAIEQLRVLTATLGASTPVARRVEALATLATALLATGQRDEAAARFAAIARLDPFHELDTIHFNPEVIAAYRSVRRATPAVGVRVPADTTLLPDQDAWPIRVAVGRPGRVRLRLVPQEPGSDSLVAAVNVDGERTVPLLLSVREAGGLRPGVYRLAGEWMEGEAAVATTHLGIVIARGAVDTVEHEAPPAGELFRREHRPGPPRLGVALLGVLAGAATAALPQLLSGDAEPAPHARAASVGVAATISLSGIVGAFRGRARVPIPANIEYNDGIRAAWRERNRAIAEANEAHRRSAPIRLRAEGP